MIGAIAHLLPRDTLAAEYRDDVTDILSAAEEWQAGNLPLNAVMHLGTIAYNGRPSPQYSRFVAVATTRPGTPGRAALMEIQRLVNRQHGEETPFGMMSSFDTHLHDAAVRFVRANEPPPWE